MGFYEVLAQVIELLQREGRTSYRALKRQFHLDDDYLEDLKVELIDVKQLAMDQDGKMLVWTGAPTTASPPAPSQERPPLSYTPPYLAEKIRTTRSALAGERKQVTVLFADLKDSTELIKDLDPEAAQQLLDPALHRMMDAVHRYEGTVNQILGDGIMALFGAPIAHEDHALRACYAALAMQAALRDYTEEVRRVRGLEMRIRVGLNSGEVVVRTIGNDLHMDYSAVGQTTHLAARMEQLATPGTIRLTATTLRLVEGAVRVNALGPVPVKGLTEPVEVFELTGVSGIRRRLQAAVARGLTRFVGRDAELASMRQAMEQAAAGHGQIVALVGEAGVGKSRLVYECVHSHRTQGWLVLESASVSYGKATPYFPVIDLLKRYAHVEEADDTRTIRASMTGQVLTLDDALQEHVPALLALLEALPDDSPFRHLDPPQRRQRILEALKRVLVRESQVQPLLLVFEDLHWLDAETQALLDSLVDSLPTTQILLLVNYRPEYHHAWGSKTYYTQLRLDPLLAESADEFLQALLGDGAGAQHATPLQALKQLLIARTGGNPFFLEESVRTLVETGVLVGERGHYRLAQDVSTLQMPATVQAVLAARIDRLPPEEKRLLQTAAVIGTEIPLPLLQAIAELPEDALQRGLMHLQATEFLYEVRLFPEHAYTFKHALTHEVAYGSLLQERRRALHARIVEALETLAGDRQDEYVERLAHHAGRGEVWDKALVYCRQAGDKALTRSAYREAVGCFEQALSALPHLPETRATREQAIDLRLALRTAFYPSGDFERSLAYLREAESLAVALDDSRRLGQVWRLLAIHFYFMGAYDQAIAAAQRVLALATASGDVVLQAMVNQTLGMTYQVQGDYRQAIDCFGQTVASLDGVRRHERFGNALLPAVQSRAFLAWCHAELGTFVEGQACGDEGLRIAEAVAHPGSLMLASWGIGLLSLRHGDLRRALPLLERAVVLCRDVDLPLYFPWIAPALGVAYTLSGHLADAMPLLTQALEQTTATAQETPGLQVFCSLALGEAQMLAGRLEVAQALAEDALALARTQQERGHQAYALRLLGEIYARHDPPEIESAETHYCQAIALANELGMRPLQAHCHLGLGTLYGKMGRTEPARVALSTAIDLYRAMDMTFWLPQAEAALARIA
jgi:class 3 adenylate cyclase/tetratricopeptide (TPR) repeat protein